jgi:Family of unknown function (DUF5723)
MGISILQRARLFAVIMLPVLGLFSNLHAQQNQSLSMSHDVWQSSFTNPANQPDRKFIIALPGGQVDYYLPDVKVKDLFSSKNLLNFNNGLNSLRERNEFAAREQAELLGIGFRIKKNIWIMAHAGITGTQRFVFNKDLARLFVLGNGQFVGQTLELGPQLEISSALEFGIQGSWKINDKWQVGTRIYRRRGLVALATDPNQFDLYTDTEVYDLTLTTDYQVNATTAVENVSWPSGNNLPKIDWGSRTKSSGRGTAFDIGATYSLTEKLSFSASIININNRINWDGGVGYKSQGTFTLEGVRLQNILTLDSLRFIDQVDSFINVVTPQEISSPSFTTRVPTRYLIGATYQPVEKWMLHGYLTHERNKEINYTGLLVGARWSPHRIIDVGVNYNARYGFVTNIGATLSLNLGPLQLYGMTDNIGYVFSPLTSTRYNARVGANLVFGKKQIKEPKKPRA